MSTIQRRAQWISENGLWKVYGVVRCMEGIDICEVLIMKLKKGRHEFYYGKNVPAYVLKERDLLYESLK